MIYSSPTIFLNDFKNKKKIGKQVGTEQIPYLCLPLGPGINLHGYLTTLLISIGSFNLRFHTDEVELFK